MEQVEVYKEQLKQIDLALGATTDPSEKAELLSLKQSIVELLSLTGDDKVITVENGATNSALDDEYALFMSELGEENGAETKNRFKENSSSSFKFDLETIEGKKCRAPHNHQWGSIAYHNAMVCSIESSDLTNEENIKVRVLFTNPTHKEMIPCPYYFENDCKFSEENCHYSHGEVVPFLSLQEYEEPDFKRISVGSRVLAKQNNLWHSARIKSIYKEKCLVKFESNQKPLEVLFEEIFPLANDADMTDSSDSEDNDDIDDNEDIINLSLMITPSSQALGEWEKHTKGIGSKLMQKMGYIVGTGLGRKGEGRVDPVTAVVLPPGKSLDHCMKLREQAGGDKDLFSAERKLKRMQKQQEARSKREYEKEKNNVDVFSFINNTLTPSTSDNTFTKTKHRMEIKKDTSRDLNVASLRTEENIKGVERDLYKIRESLSRHVDRTSLVHKQLKTKLYEKESELKNLQSQALNIKNEQSMRNDKRKLTIF